MICWRQCCLVVVSCGIVLSPSACLQALSTAESNLIQRKSPYLLSPFQFSIFNFQFSIFNFQFLPFSSPSLPLLFPFSSSMVQGIILAGILLPWNHDAKIQPFSVGICRLRRIGLDCSRLFPICLGKGLLTEPPASRK